MPMAAFTRVLATKSRMARSVSVSKKYMSSMSTAKGSLSPGLTRVSGTTRATPSPSLTAAASSWSTAPSASTRLASMVKWTTSSEPSASTSSTFPMSVGPVQAAPGSGGDLYTHRATIAALLAPWFSRRTVADLAAAFAGTSVPWARLHNLADRPGSRR